MTTPAPTGPIDYAEARDRMVDGQVRPNKVTDPRLIQAMRAIPRERFLPPALACRAYLDEDIDLPGNRALMEPMVIARLVQGLRVRQGETVLVAAAGTGYGAALLAACGAVVTALEEDEALIAIARTVLPPGVTLVQGPIRSGWPGAAPYDAILLEGAVETLPEILVTQLKPEGRLTTVLTRANPNGQGRAPGQGVLAEAVPVDGKLHLRARPFFECSTPALPQFQPLPAFHF